MKPIRIANLYEQLQGARHHAKSLMSLSNFFKITLWEDAFALIIIMVGS